MPYIHLFAAVILEVVATTLLKESNGFKEVMPTVFSLLIYGITFYLMSVCMQRIPVAVVYAVWSGVGIVLITLASFIFHKQTLDLPALLGMVMIIFGVILIKLFSKFV